MTKFLSGRQRQLNVGISSFTENNTVVQVTGKVGIGTTVSKTPIQIDNFGIKSGVGTFSASVGVTTDIDSFEVSTDNFRMLEYTLHVHYQSYFQAQKILVIQNGTTAYSQEYAVMSHPDLIVSAGSTISNGYCKLQVTPEIGVVGVTTYRFVRNTVF
jgi:hypothetical protein